MSRPGTARIVGRDRPHRPIHTQDYYDAVADDLRYAANADDARAILRDIRQQVLSGEYKGLRK
jgi:hypothetical protein